MTNTGPRPVTVPDDAQTAAAPSVSRGQVLRSLLWTLLVISAVANTLASFAGADTGVHLVCGAVTAVTGGLLIARRLRQSR
ncbi:hypothetical protein GCM10012287_04980 [Streptomyces daqingensis]|uniref:DUF202 domain-containing protein n=1 Tax=Streptomyces daqingensis TaxID=1472640 RepID=A0ABQ2LTC4_9ACTN|nr:hypothetical protein [Streptomyces daqingensis]GGO42961.1 hypothetical protein GCM10012287_04980 [Streptomyces daqingensis]